MEVFRKLVGFTLSIALVGCALTFTMFSVSELRGYQAMVALIAGTAAFGWLAVGPFGQALKRMLGDDAKPALPEPSAEFYDLNDQVQAMSLEMQRIQELEERLDFAERLLTQRQAVDGAVGGVPHGGS